MPGHGRGKRFVALTTLIAAAIPFGSHAARASKEHERVHAGHNPQISARNGHRMGHARDIDVTSRHNNRWHNVRHGHRVAFGGNISCVPFARAESGIEVSGNAAEWWANAAGMYARGHRPEAGSVLNFRSNEHMPLGHVAVVSNVIDDRRVEIDHANWAGPGSMRGRVNRGVTVVDVSANNDWSAVRVELGHSGSFGSVYPTYGFIYGKADHGGQGVRLAIATPSPIPVLNPAPRILRARIQRVAATRIAMDEEVAEAPMTNRRGLDLSLSTTSVTGHGSAQSTAWFTDAPNRSLR